MSKQDSLADVQPQKRQKLEPPENGGKLYSFEKEIEKSVSKYLCKRQIYFYVNYDLLLFRSGF